MGDIFHSRVARSACHLLTKFGSKVVLCGPPELVPEVATTLAPGVSVTRHLEEALRGTDVITLLRVRKNGSAGLKLRLDDYIARYQMTAHRLKMAKKDAIVMHPGPIIPRAGADWRGRGWAAIGDRGGSAEWRAHAHGDSGASGGRVR